MPGSSRNTDFSEYQPYTSYVIATQHSADTDNLLFLTLINTGGSSRGQCSNRRRVSSKRRGLEVRVLIKPAFIRRFTV